MVIADCNTHFELNVQPGVCIQTQVGSAARKEVVGSWTQTSFVKGQWRLGPLSLRCFLAIAMRVEEVFPHDSTCGVNACNFKFAGE